MAGGDRGEAEHLAVTIAALIRAGDMTVEQVDGGLRLTGARSLSIPPPDDRHASSVAERSELVFALLARLLARRPSATSNKCLNLR